MLRNASLPGVESVCHRTAYFDLPQCKPHKPGKNEYVTRNLFREMLDDEEEHFHWLETQIELAQKIGLQNYLQSRM